MNSASLRRPLGCLKGTFRQTRQQRLMQRSMATTVDANPSSNPQQPPPPPPASSKPTDPSSNSKPTKPSFKGQNVQIHRHFALPPPVPSVRATHKDPMPALTTKQLARLDPTGARSRLFDRSRPDSAKAGDVLLVTKRTGEPFAGVLLSIRRRGPDTAILLRGQMMRVGVESWHKVYSPSVSGIDIVWRRPKRARRARLTYMRQPKHDIGNVNHLLSAWRRERISMRGRAGGRGSIETRF